LYFAASDIQSNKKRLQVSFETLYNMYDVVL